MSERPQAERLARLQRIITLMYGDRGGSEMARKIGVAPTQLAVTLRGERRVTDALEAKVAKIVTDEAGEIISRAKAAYRLSRQIGEDLVGSDMTVEGENLDSSEV